MHFVHVAHQVTPYWPSTQLGRTVAEIAAAQRAHGHAVTIIAPAPAGDDLGASSRLAKRLTPLTARTATGAEVDVEVLESRTTDALVRLLRFPDTLSLDRAALSALPDQFDVLQVHGPIPVDAAALGAAAAEVTLVRSLYDARTDYAPIAGQFDDAGAIVVPRRDFLAALPEGSTVREALTKVAERVHTLPHGIDHRRYDPARDGLLAASYGPGDLEGKLACRRLLQEQADLALRDDIAIILMWPGDGGTRSSEQWANMDSHMEELLALEAQFVLLHPATSDGPLGGHISALAADMKAIGAGRCGVIDAAPDAIRRALAGADAVVFADPDAATPRSALAALCYGTAPIAPAHGVYADCLVEYDAASRSGSAVLYSVGSDELLTAVARASRTLADADRRAIWVECCLNHDAGWRRYVRGLTELLAAS